LNPGPSYFAVFHNLFESGGEKATDSASYRTRMAVGIKRIRYPGRKSRIAFSRAICNFFIRNEILNQSSLMQQTKNTKHIISRIPSVVYPLHKPSDKQTNSK
jgi:hypothetical protein